MRSPVRAKLSINQMRRGRLHARSCRHVRVDGPYRPSGRNASPSGITRSTIMSPAQGSPGSWTEIRPSARAHTRPADRAHAPPPSSTVPTSQQRTPKGCDGGPCTDKERGSAPSDGCAPEIRFVGGQSDKGDGAYDRDRRGHT
jgi:hypothetical protein